MTAADLSAYVGAPPSDLEFVSDCWDVAHALVDKLVGSATVPAAVMSRAKLECGSELYHKRQAPNGIAQFASFDGAPVRVARDPMAAAIPILLPYIGLGAA